MTAIFEPKLDWAPDGRAEKILFDHFWSSKGWRKGNTSAEDIAYAKQAEYMFDPIIVSHDEIIDRLVDLVSELEAFDVAQAFANSLSTRRLDLRSALGSFAANLRLRRHSFEARPLRCCPGNPQCHTCKMYEIGGVDDLNVLNFERFKWGGVRHNQPLYALFDLVRFRATRREPGTVNLDPLRCILDIAANASADFKPNDLVKSIAPYVAGDAAQRRVVIECLGYAGIIQPSAHPGFFEGYPLDREYPGGKNDWAYPVAWWRGRDGVNAAALEFYFPNLKL